MPISNGFHSLSVQLSSLAVSLPHSLSLLSSSPASSSSFSPLTRDISAGDSSSQDSSVVNFHLNFPAGDYIEGLLAVIALVAGLILCFAGKRLFRPLLWLFAFLFCGGLLYYTILVNSHFSSLTCFIIAACLSLVIGVILGLLASLCLFICGASVGYICWIGFVSLFPNTVATAPGGVYTVLAIAMLAFGILALVYEQLILLFLTPILGSFLFAQGLDFFTHLHMNAMAVMHGDTTCSDAKCYGYNAIFLVLAVSGFGVQWFGWKKGEEKKSGVMAANTPYIQQA